MKFYITSHQASKSNKLLACSPIFTPFYPIQLLHNASYLIIHGYLQTYLSTCSVSKLFNLFSLQAQCVFFRQNFILVGKEKLGLPSTIHQQQVMQWLFLSTVLIGLECGCAKNCTKICLCCVILRRKQSVKFICTMSCLNLL